MDHTSVEENSIEIDDQDYSFSSGSSEKNIVNENGPRIGKYRFFLLLLFLLFHSNSFEFNIKLKYLLRNKRF